MYTVVQSPGYKRVIMHVP